MLNETDIKEKTSLDPHLSGRRIEVGFEYLEIFFASQKNFLEFLKKLDSEKREDFLYSIHFYRNHDVLQICHKMPEERPLDIFIIIITFAIIENLSQDVKGSHKCIKDFFTNNLTNQEIKEFKLQDNNDSEKNAVDILYEARNDFIHRAQRFYFNNTTGFAEVNQIKERSGNSYLGIIELSREKYVKLFWKAFLRFFNCKI